MADNIWGYAKNAAPGLFDLGAGIYGRNAGAKEADQRLRTAQGPLFQTQMQGAQTALDRAGSMDPRAIGQERFNAAQGLLKGTDAASMDDLMRRLQASGQGGIASFSGVAPGGQAINPQMAAFLKVKADRDAQMAYDSLDKGDAALDKMVQRGGMLSGQAANTQAAGMKAQGALPSRSAGNMALLKGLGGIAKDSGLFGGGMDWLRKNNPFSNGGWGNFDFGAGDSSFFGG